VDIILDLENQQKNQPPQAKNIKTHTLTLNLKRKLFSTTCINRDTKCTSSSQDDLRAFRVPNSYNSNPITHREVPQLNIMRIRFQTYTSSQRQSPKHTRSVLSMGLSLCAMCYSCLWLQSSTAKFATFLRGSTIGKVACWSKGHVEEGFRH
jgi:hypothetical protein